MSQFDRVLSADEAAERLDVTKPRISQLLKELCTFVDPPIFELDSPEGRPVGTSRVTHRTITESSIEAYEQRHPWSASGQRRRRHPSVREVRSKSSAPDKRTPRDARSSSVQALRLELEHQLNLNRELREKLERQQRGAIERDRALKHQIVDMEAELELNRRNGESLVEDLAGLRSAFDAYGDVLTQDVGPQDSSGI